MRTGPHRAGLAAPERVEAEADSWPQRALPPQCCSPGLSWCPECSPARTSQRSVGGGGGHRDCSRSGILALPPDRADSRCYSCFPCKQPGRVGWAFPRGDTGALACHALVSLFGGPPGTSRGLSSLSGAGQAWGLLASSFLPEEPRRCQGKRRDFAESEALDSAFGPGHERCACTCLAWRLESHLGLCKAAAPPPPSSCCSPPPDPEGPSTLKSVWGRHRRRREWRFFLADLDAAYCENVDCKQALSFGEGGLEMSQVNKCL